MNANFIRQFTLFSIALYALTLTACGSQIVTIQPTSLSVLPATATDASTLTPSQMTTLTPAPSHIASATSCLGLAATPVNTPGPWVYGDYWDKLAISRIPVKDMLCASPEEIMSKLVLQRLETLKTNSKGQQCNLEDYTLNNVKIMTDTTQYDFVAWVDYRVKPGRFGDCSWMTTRPSTIEKDGWITTHDVFGVYRENGYFRLIILNAWEV